METKVHKTGRIEFEEISKYSNESGGEKYYKVVTPLNDNEIELLRDLLEELSQIAVLFAQAIKEDFGEHEDDFSNHVHYTANLERNTISIEWINLTFIRFCFKNIHPVYNEDNSSLGIDHELMIVRKHDWMFPYIQCDENCFVMRGSLDCQESSYEIPLFVFDIRDAEYFEENKRKCIQIYSNFLQKVFEPVLHSLRNEWKIAEE